MLHSFTGVKIQDIPPLRRRGRTDIYGHLSVFLPLPMSCSCRDGADISPDGLPDPGVNRGFFLLTASSGESNGFMQTGKIFCKNTGRYIEKPPAPSGTEG